MAQLMEAVQLIGVFTGGSNHHFKTAGPKKVAAKFPTAKPITLNKRNFFISLVKYDS